MNSSNNNDIDKVVEVRRAKKNAFLKKYYHERMQDPVFAENCRVKALERYYAKKQKKQDLSGIPSKRVGRPRTFPIL
jgi:CRISPR/Cas system-associated endoribonuclease Cas2